MVETWLSKFSSASSTDQGKRCETMAVQSRLMVARGHVVASKGQPNVVVALCAEIVAIHNGYGLSTHQLMCPEASFSSKLVFVCRVEA